jgi:hypothetical protein
MVVAVPRQACDGWHRLVFRPSQFLSRENRVAPAGCRKREIEAKGKRSWHLPVGLDDHCKCASPRIWGVTVRSRCGQLDLACLKPEMEGWGVGDYQR